MTTYDERQEVIKLIIEAVRAGARKVKACEELGLDIRSFQRWLKNPEGDKRKGAVKNIKNKLSDEEKDRIVENCCSKRFMNLTPYEIVPILAEEGIYLASESTIYRVLKEKKLLKYRGNSNKKRKIETIEKKATGPNQICSWDITYLRTSVNGKFYYLYLFMDIWSRLIVGWEIHEVESGQIASDIMRKICKNRNIQNNDILLLHSDNGGPMRSSTMLSTLHLLGVTPSFSRPSVSNDNAFSESLFKTLKYTAGYPKYFKSIEAANNWTLHFADWYNNCHRHSKIGYVTPFQRHNGKDIEIFKIRNKVYAEAQKKNPERWSKKVKHWEKPVEVYLKKANNNKKIA